MSSWSLASAVSPNVTSGDVIRLTNLKSSSETNLPTRGSGGSGGHGGSGGLPRPTTPVPAKKLASKRPPHLTLNVKSKSHDAPLAETENMVLSTSESIYGTPMGATPISSPANQSQRSQKSQNSVESRYSTSTATSGGSIFPHEQYKTIKKINIGFENIRYTTKFGIFQRETKDVLKGLTGYFKSGELSAVVGPSGAGKSTLLNILSGYTIHGYTGDFRVNGNRRDLKAFKPNVAFIRQDTSLQAFLSVKEAMHFAANLKIGTHMTLNEKKERVKSILEAIGMYENRHTRTGNLSGGQRKRLAIALELVNNPPVLILDEPTSGLDSSTSNQLINLLKKLALEGRTVICTIHQPSALTFAMFDHLYAIGEGQCIYAGGSQNLLPFLGALNLHCPESYNPADYLMEIATHDYDTEEDNQLEKLVALMDNGRNEDYRQSKSARVAQLAALKKVDQLMAAGLITPVTAPVMSSSVSVPFPQSSTFKPLTPINELSSRVWDSQTAGIGSGDVGGPSAGSCCKPKKKKPKPAIELDPSHLCKRQNIYATPFYRQLSILLVRTFLLIWRDSSLTTMRFAIHLITGLLIGILYFGIGNDAANTLNIIRYLFYTIMFIMYCAFSGILVKFPLEFPIVSREHFNRWYSLRAYYVAITLADLPIQIICSALFIVPTYLMTQQPLELWRFGLFFLIVFVTALVSQSIGLAVGAALSLKLGSILGPLFICPFLQFSGFFLMEKDAPACLRWMFDISFLKYSLEGSMMAIFGYGRERLECEEMYCHLRMPNQILKTMDMANANYTLALVFLLSILVFLRILAFYIMSFRLRLFRSICRRPMDDNAVQIQANGLAQKQKAVELHFSQVSYSLKGATKGSSPILNEACGVFKSGRLTAILGPSGAGKSTLLNALAGFKLQGVSGQFLLNGRPRDMMTFRKMSAYIAQDFVMLNLLSVEETLRVSVDLKMPSSTVPQEKQKIIDDIIDVLQLQSCRRTLVKNLSGGEHKRLSIGIELVTNPPIMFFDEPTSGLDCVASYQVICHLQRLAHDGRIVVCVVHQPGSRLFQLFDDVLVLAHGEVLYAGEQREMLGTFAQSGHICPQYYNPADFALEVCSQSSTTERCDSLITQNKNFHCNSSNVVKLQVDEETALIDVHKDAQDLSHLRGKEQVGFWIQLSVLLRRHLRSMWRDLVAVQMRVVMHVVVALLLGVVYWQIGSDAGKIVSNVSCLFFVILFVFAGNAMPSILLCMQDSAVFIREYYNGWYSLGAYYLSKVLADLPMQLTCPTLFISIGYFMTGQPPEQHRFAMCWGICVMTAFIGHFIGVIAGSMFPMQLAIFLVPSATIPFLLFSGFFIRLNELSWFLRPICNVSFFRYIFEGLMRAIYGYDRGELECHAAMNFCYYRTADQFLKDFDMQGDEFGWDIAVLGFFVILLLLAFFVTLTTVIRRALR
ncbi:ABC transporter G family member 41 [Drosophila eugracilis]|uniref:ABC transporter G family member 41 n=1 Tax=Drosophila eugracilis TaxID=29029 RepID=UPI001BDAF434|nr:ABC transporter G family member 41 [Drosophila eugracilis]